MPEPGGSRSRTGFRRRGLTRGHLTASARRRALARVEVLVFSSVLVDGGSELVYRHLGNIGTLSNILVGGGAMARRSLMMFGVILLVATSCKVSPRVNAKYTLNGVVRCASGQSAVGETEDQVSGRVAFGAATGARRGPGCEVEDELRPGWARLSVGATLYRRVGNDFVQCGADAPIAVTTSERSILTSKSNLCPSGFYQTAGLHAFMASGGAVSGFSTLTPVAYNS